MAGRGTQHRYVNAVYRLSWTFNKQDNFAQSDGEFGEFHTEIKYHLGRVFIGSSFIFSLERGSNAGRLHYQGHIKLKTKLRPTEFASKCRDFLPGVHVSADSTIGSTQAEFYCFEVGKAGYVSGPYMDKDYKLPYDGSDLISFDTFYSWQLDIFNMLNGPIDRDKIVWVCNERGGCGKSEFCKYMYFHFKIPKLQVAKASDLKNLVYKMADSATYLVDITRTISAQDSMDDMYCALEDLKNGFVVNTKYETGMKCFARPHVVVFSNQMPDLTKLSGYKWSVFRVTDTKTLIAIPLFLN